MKEKIVSLFCIFVLASGLLYGQAYPGLTLFSPNNSRYSYLCDLNNNIVKTWTHSRNGGYSSYLTKDGTIVRTAVSSGTSLNGGGAQGMLQKYDWKGNLIWEYTYSTSTYRAHHDIEVMPNGNILMIAWEVKTAAQSVAAGLNHSAVLWPDHLIEVQPTGSSGGNIVWKWHFWDHLVQDYDPTKANYGVVANHPELLDINVGSTSGDWMHINGISYNPELDQIVISSHNLNEIYVIDHSTTIEEAAGHTGGRYGRGGDILYRWGKPANYRAPGAQVFKVVHNSCWIPDGLPGAGNILAFNNREGQGTSMVIEIIPPHDGQGNYSLTPGAAYGPAAPVWSYTASGFYSNHLGGNQRLPNGNTVIAQSTSGKLFEVDSSGNIVWSYNRGGQIPRIQRYGFEYEGLRMFQPGELVINEFQALNDSIPDPNGENDPWIEIFNNSDKEAYVGGRYLSDASNQLNKWTFPTGTVIPSYGYLIIWADGNIAQNGIHCSFSLSGTGGKIFLSNIDHTIVDSVVYGVQTVNKSMARKPNGVGSFVLSDPTFNGNNDYSPPPPPIVTIKFMDVVINEYMVLNDSIPDPNGDYDQWIEFYNNTDSVINLSGISLSNEFDKINKWTFPDGTQILPKEYLIVWADEDTTQNGIHTNFKLMPEGSLYFSNKDSSLIDSLYYGEQLANLTYSRIPNGVGEFVLSFPTPAKENLVYIPSIIKEIDIPKDFLLEQNYPNPFNPSTVIRYTIPEDEYVNLRLYDVLGGEIGVLVSEYKKGGIYQYELRADKYNLHSGVYFYERRAGTYRGVRKLVLMK